MSAPAAHHFAEQTNQVDRLEELSDFRNFKMLSDTLAVRFSRRITLIFGANSSGKSSLCEALTRIVQTWLPNILSRLNAALISARCVNACGKLPRASPSGPVCSE